jgi:hypothetical protein
VIPIAQLREATIWQAYLLPAMFPDVAVDHIIQLVNSCDRSAHPMIADVLEQHGLPALASIWRQI